MTAEVEETEAEETEAEETETDELGVYVHVPFCRRRCDYCAFATFTDRDHLMERYTRACLRQIRSAVESGQLVAASSVFFGGGTPSRLPARDLGALLAAIPRRDDAEVTVECNPEDVTADLLSGYRCDGVTRISLGVQSLVPRVLASLGRHHPVDEARRAARLVADGGFRSWNLDLIFGAVGEDDLDWRRSLEEVLSWAGRPPHLSLYALAVEPGTPLAADPTRHPDDDVQARRYRWADEVLGRAGYLWEEISNWAQPGHGCRHNRLYWRQGDYLGFGSAAHSHRRGRRWWNIRSPDRYIEAVEREASPVAGEETLTAEQRRFERLALAIRTPAGVPASMLSPPAQSALDDLEGLVERRGGRVVLTLAGRLLANEITARLGEGDPGGRDPGAERARERQPVSSRP